jgi:hypothetical protein
VLALLAAPCVAEERSHQKPLRGAIAASPVGPGSTDAAVGRPVSSTDAELEARYGAARKAAEQREREWDRKMKQLAKDVCTGC